MFLSKMDKTNYLGLEPLHCFLTTDFHWSCNTALNKVKPTVSYKYSLVQNDPFA